MALTERSTHREKPGNLLLSVPIATAEVIFDGALVAISAAGELQNWSDALTAGNTSFFLGVARITEQSGVSAPTGEAKTGSTALDVEAAVDTSGVSLESVSVAGASAANVGNLVYASDENTLTMTATPGEAPIGWLTKFFAGSTANVRLFTPGEHRAHTFEPTIDPGNDAIRIFTRTTAVMSTTLTDADDVLLVDAASGTATVDLPAAADNVGKRFTIKKIDSSKFFVSVVPTGGDLVDGEIVINVRFKDAVAEVVSDGGTEWQLAQVTPNRGRDNFEILTIDTEPTVESNVLLISASSGPRTYSLPDVATLTGRTFSVKKTDQTANPVTIAALTSQTIDGEASVSITAPQGTIVFYAAQLAWHIISGSTSVPKIRTFTATTADLADSVTHLDDVLLVDATAGATTITLPDAPEVTARRFIVKKIDSSANAVTVDALGTTAGNNLIDGASSLSIAAEDDASEFISDGTAWFIIGSKLAGEPPSFGPIVDKTINTAGAVSVTGRHLRLSGTTADTLTDLTNPGNLKDGELVMIRAASGQTIVVETNTGNIRLDNGIDITLQTVNHNIVLAWNDTSGRFFQVSTGVGQA